MGIIVWCIKKTTLVVRKFLQCTEEILSKGEIYTVYRRDPKCGGTLYMCKEESLAWGLSI